MNPQSKAIAILTMNGQAAFKSKVSKGMAIGNALSDELSLPDCVACAMEMMSQNNRHLTVAVIDALECNQGKAQRKGNILTIERIRKIGTYLN